MDEFVFIDFFNFKNNYLFYLNYLSILHNNDLRNRYQILKKRIVLKLNLNGHEILKLGYQTKEIGDY